MDGVYRLQLQSPEERREENHGYDPLRTLPPAYRDGEEPLPTSNATFGYESPTERVRNVVNTIETGLASILNGEDDGLSMVTDEWVKKESLYPMCPETDGDVAEVDQVDFYVMYQEKVEFDPAYDDIVMFSREKVPYSEQEWENMLDEVNDEFCPDE